MRDRLEVLARLVVDERLRGQRGPVERAVAARGCRPRTARRAWRARASPARPPRGRSGRRRPRPRPARRASRRRSTSPTRSRPSARPSTRPVSLREPARSRPAPASGACVLLRRPARSRRAAATDRGVRVWSMRVASTARALQTCRRRLLSDPGSRFRCNFPLPRREGHAPVRPKAERARACAARARHARPSQRRLDGGDGPAPASCSPRSCRGAGVREPVGRAELRAACAHRGVEQRRGRVRVARDVRGSCGAFHFRGRPCSRSARQTHVARLRPARGCTAPL